MRSLLTFDPVIPIVARAFSTSFDLAPIILMTLRTCESGVAELRWNRPSHPQNANHVHFEVCKYDFKFYSLSTFSWLKYLMCK